METTDRHVEYWDVRVERRYSPVYTLAGKRYDENPFPPVVVNVSAQFDTDTSAAAFEAAVRELLEKA